MKRATGAYRINYQNVTGSHHNQPFTTSISRDYTSCSLFWCKLVLLLYRYKWISIIRLWWLSQWLATC